MAIKDNMRKLEKLDSPIDIGDFTIDFGNVNKKKVVFMGTPQFSVPILEMLIENYDVVLVVCQPDKEKDRKGKIIIPPIKQLALDNDIEVFQPLKIRDDYKRVLDANPDIIITCAYGQIIPKELLEYPKYGCINVHGSLLPKYRGGAPIHWALINGEKETGITIMYMSEKMDAGDIISQETIKITDDTILDTLFNDMSLLGAKLLKETLPNIINDTVNRIKQDENKVTFGFNINKQDEIIDFSKNVEDVFNLIRGLNSNPGAYTYYNNKRMKIYRVEKMEDNNLKDKSYGKIVKLDKDSFYIECNGGYIRVLELALEGKKKCLTRDFLNGVNKKELIGSVLKNEKE